MTKKSSGRDQGRPGREDPKGRRRAARLTEDQLLIVAMLEEVLEGEPALLADIAHLTGLSEERVRQAIYDGSR
jgi:hypothetical protein